MAGNPNPDTSGLKPFVKGESGNPGGKTKAQRVAEVQAAEDSAKIRALMTAAVLKQIESGEPAQNLIDPAVLKLFKDSEDRAHGTPKSTTEMSGVDGGPIQTEDTGAGAAKLIAHLDAIAERS